jgi:ELWxxDGT repeat protein
VKDIVPTGTDPLTGSESFRRVSLASMNSTVYFSAFDSRCGRELWKSNVTQAGTALLKDIIAGATGSNAHRASRERELQIEAGNVSQELYLLKIEAQNGYQALRFVKQ